MRSLGIDLEERTYWSLADIGISELPDLLFKSLMTLEYISETLSTAKKLYLDQNLETERVYSDVVKRLISMEDGYKVTEARAHAKTHDEYIQSAKKLNTLDAYVDYLNRLIENLNRYHYTVKSRIDGMKQVEKKYPGL